MLATVLNAHKMYPCKQLLDFCMPAYILYETIDFVIDSFQNIMVLFCLRPFYYKKCIYIHRTVNKVVPTCIMCILKRLLGLNKFKY